MVCISNNTEYTIFGMNKWNCEFLAMWKINVDLNSICATFSHKQINARVKKKLPSNIKIHFQLEARPSTRDFVKLLLWKYGVHEFWNLDRKLKINNVFFWKFKIDEFKKLKCSKTISSHLSV